MSNCIFLTDIRAILQYICSLRIEDLFSCFALNIRFARLAKRRLSYLISKSRRKAIAIGFFLKIDFCVIKINK